jgi:hypothetical protein
MDHHGHKIRELKKGLWANIQAKRGEAPAKPGDKGYPDSKQWKKLSGSPRRQDS